ncbi:hypothetical protein [Nakamurella leprariae]|uniref:Uncharacterized protein n=1 Tax=Nakamurella leprariae TaxID=2803911 RepID=A0A939C1K5_9ACTN|nr:hypothetical protein [Nakamurella leprariae]MBM9467247.1 hypothetical protein [Nakamurella leprariae]
MIAEDCPICQGQGRLELGRPALAQAARTGGPEAVALAVDYALEVQARKDLAPQHPDWLRARTNLARVVAALRARGLLAPTPSPIDPSSVLPAQHPRPPIEQVRATAKHLTPGYQRGDHERLYAPAPCQYGPDERPTEHGGIPGFSAAGFIAHLTRVCDPVDPVDPHTSTRHRAQSRDRQGRFAKVLVSAAALDQALF